MPNRSSLKRFTQRSLWLKTHLYLALCLGFFFALMGLTGSISVYRTAIDEFLNPELVITQPQTQRQSLDKIMAAVQTAHPNLTGVWTLEMPNSPHSMITAWYDKPPATFFEFHSPLMVSVNPYTAKVIMSRYWGHTFTTWLLDLHTQLHLDGFGWSVIGVFGVLLILSISTGFYLWWSDGRRLWQAMTIKYKNGLMRLLFDLHRLIGLIIAPIVLILALTGIQLSYPSVLENVFATSGMAHGQTGRTLISTAKPNNHSTSLEAAEFIARSGFPRAELRRVTTPAGDTGIYQINLRQRDEINQRHPFTTVWIDRWSGQIREIRNPSQFNTGEKIITWLWPLHTGEALGSIGRFIWFLSGLSLCFLYVTGVLHWLYRKGKVKDRPVNFAALKPYAERLEQVAYRVAVSLMTLTIMSVRKITPYAKTASLWLWQSFQRNLARLRS